MTTKQGKRQEELRKLALKTIKKADEFMVVTPSKVVWSDNYDSVADQVTAILVPRDLAPMFPKKEK